MKNWLREDMRPLLETTLERSALVNERFQMGTVRRLLEEHMAHKANHNHVLWALLNAALWHERFVEGRGPS